MAAETIAIVVGAGIGAIATLFGAVIAGWFGSVRLDKQLTTQRAIFEEQLKAAHERYEKEGQRQRHLQLRDKQLGAMAEVAGILYAWLHRNHEMVLDGFVAGLKSDELWNAQEMRSKYALTLRLPVGKPRKRSATGSPTSR